MFFLLKKGRIVLLVVHAACITLIKPLFHKINRYGAIVFYVASNVGTRNWCDTNSIVWHCMAIFDQHFRLPL